MCEIHSMHLVHKTSVLKTSGLKSAMKQNRVNSLTSYARDYLIDKILMIIKSFIVNQ